MVQQQTEVVKIEPYLRKDGCDVVDGITIIHLDGLSILGEYEDGTMLAMCFHEDHYVTRHQKGDEDTPEEARRRFQAIEAEGAHAAMRGTQALAFALKLTIATQDCDKWDSARLLKKAMTDALDIAGGSINPGKVEFVGRLEEQNGDH